MAVPQQGSILYALVARGTDVLAEHIPQGLAGNFAQVTRVLLSRIDPEQDRASYMLDGYQFHYIVAKKLIYLCMADESFGNQIPFDFLEDVKLRFSAAYGASASTAIAYSFNSEFSTILHSRLDYYNNAKYNSSKLSAVQTELYQARNVMADNIDRVLERGDKIELLVDKSDQLDASALQFKKRSTRLKRSLWWKNAKLLALGGVGILAVLYLILGISCGPTLSHC